MQNLTIDHVSNPLTNQKDRVEIAFDNQTLREVVDSVIPEGMEFRVLKNGQLVEASSVEMDKLVAVHDDIVVIPIIHGKAVGRIIGFVVIAILAYYTGGAAAGAYSGAGASAGMSAGLASYSGMAYAVGAAAAAAVTIAGGMLINQLLPPEMATMNAMESYAAGSHYSWNPHVTQAQGVVVQRIYGKLRAKHGNIINAYRGVRTGLNPNDLNVMISYGYGPVKSIQDVRINDQYETEDTTLTVHRRLGYLEQPAIPGFENVVLEDATQSILTKAAGEFTRSITAGHDKVAIAISFPSGLFDTKLTTGKRVPASATFSAYLINDTTEEIVHFSGDGNATAIAAETKWSFGEMLHYVEERGDRGPATINHWVQYDTKVSTDIDPVDLTYKDPAHPNAYWKRLSSPSNRDPAVQYYYGASAVVIVRHTTGDYFDFNLVADIHPDYSYTLHIARTNENPEHGVAASNLTSVKVIDYETVTYPKNVLLSINGAPTERFSGGLEIEPLIEGALVNVYNGTSWNVEYSTNPAWVAYDIATQPVLDNSLNIVRYDGFLPSMINLADFYAWAQLCDELVPSADGGQEKRFEFNGVYDSAKSLWDTLSMIGATYRAALYWNGTTVCCFLDTYGSVSQVFNGGNILKGTFKEVFAPWEDRATEITIRFEDEEKDYETTQLSISDLALIQTRNKVSLDAFGTTRASQAWRIATYMLKKNKYIFRTISFDSFVEYLDCSLGDVIEFQHELPDWGDGGRIHSFIEANDEIWVSGLASSLGFLEVGFTQNEYDAWLAGGDGAEINLGTASGVTLHLRTQNGDYLTLSVWGMAWDSELQRTKIILDPDSTYSTLPVTDDLFTLSCVTQGQSKKFRIINITASDDYIATITAIEYIEAIYSETDIAPDIDSVTYSPVVLFPSVSGLAVSALRYYDNYNVYARGLTVSWAAPADSTNLDHMMIDVYGGATEDGCDTYVIGGTTKANSIEFTKVELFDWYRVIVRCVNREQIVQPEASATSIIWQAVDVEDASVPLMTSGVQGLQVAYAPDGVTFTQETCVIVWDEPTASWANTNWLRSYLVTYYIHNTSTVLYSENVTTERSEFTLVKNSDKYRTFDVGVRAVNLDGTLGHENIIAVVNNQVSSTVSGVELASRYGALDITWDGLSEADLAGYEVHISTTSGFTPDPTTLTGTVDKGTTTLSTVREDDTYYVRIGGYDVFGTDGMVYSDQVGFVLSVIVDAVDFPKGISDTYKVPVLQEDSWSVSGGDTLNWTTFKIYYKSNVYNISSGSTTDKYIYWTGLSNALSTTNDLAVFQALDNLGDEWQIALNYGTAYELAWNAQANMVIGNAKIGVAAVQNAQIGNIIQSENYNGAGAGWKIDKSGQIIGSALKILNADGSTLLEADQTLADPDADVTATAIAASLAVTSGGLRVINTNTTYNDYVELTPAELTFFKNNHAYKSVKRIESGYASSGDVVVFDYDFQTTPEILVAPKEVPTYNQDSGNESYNQAMQCYAENISFSGFTARASVVNSGSYTIRYDPDSTSEDYIYAGFTNTDVTGFDVYLSASTDCSTVPEGDCPDNGDIGADVVISYRKHGTTTWYVGWSGTMGGTTKELKSFSGLSALRYDIRVEVTYTTGCSGDDCVRHDSTYIDYIVAHTTGQTTYATGDLYWIAIEGGK